MMSETPQTEAGSWVELWGLMLSKKRIVCGYLSMETLLFQFFSLPPFSVLQYGWLCLEVPQSVPF